jgi:hypothetical protein
MRSCIVLIWLRHLVTSTKLGQTTPYNIKPSDCLGLRHPRFCSLLLQSPSSASGITDSDLFSRSQMALEERWVALLCVAGVVLALCAVLYACRKHPALIVCYIDYLYIPFTHVLSACYMPCWRCRAGNATRVRYVSLHARADSYMDVAQLPPVPPHHVRCVVVSDTHGRHRWLDALPAADVLLHCGDVLLQDRAVKGASERALSDFNAWLGTLHHIPMRVVISGNHDVLCSKIGPAAVQRILTNATYLQDSAVLVPARPAPNATAPSADQPRLPAAAGDGGDVKNGTAFAAAATVSAPSKEAEPAAQGVVVYGVPYSRRGASGNDAFQFERGHTPAAYTALQTAAAACPPDSGLGIDILLSHDMPFLHNRSHAGCKQLRAVVDAVAPRVHAFGHAHEYYSVCFQRHPKTVGINASTATANVLMLHAPVVFHVPVRAVPPQQVTHLNSLLTANAAAPPAAAAK